MNLCKNKISWQCREGNKHCMSCLLSPGCSTAKGTKCWGTQEEPGLWALGEALVQLLELFNRSLLLLPMRSSCHDELLILLLVFLVKNLIIYKYAYGALKFCFKNINTGTLRHCEYWLKPWPLYIGPWTLKPICHHPSDCKSKLQQGKNLNWHKRTDISQAIEQSEIITGIFFALCDIGQFHSKNCVR